MTDRSHSKRAVSRAIYIAVLPSYRSACITALRQNAPLDLELFASPAHLDRTVKTGIPATQYHSVPLLRLANRLFLQTGSWTTAIRSRNLIVDLNPRSLTAWIFLAIRRPIAGRRTIVWGHLNPRAGGGARTAKIRRAMRRLSDGTVSYTYLDQETARKEIPGQPVWVAPNSLYFARGIAASALTKRDSVIYVGRFEPAKKVDLLLKAFAEFHGSHPDSRLTLIGGGSLQNELGVMANEFGIASAVTFPGWVEDVEALQRFYSTAFASASPGFAGLGLTQSLGFGVPMVVADDEPHSPEIELATRETVVWAHSNDPHSFASQFAELWLRRDTLPLEGVSERIRETYSAERMAAGLLAALEGRQG